MSKKHADHADLGRVTYKNLVGSCGSGTTVESHPLSPATVVEGLAEMLRGLRGDDTWWSPHVWKGNTVHRNTWESASGVALDVTYFDDRGCPSTPSKESLRRLSSELLLGNLFLVTPQGGCLIFIFKTPVVVQSQYQKALAGAAAVARDDLRRLSSYAIPDASERSAGHYEVKSANVTFTERIDLPRAVDGVAGDDSICIISPDPYSPMTLASPNTESGRHELEVFMAVLTLLRKGLLQRSPDGFYRSVEQD